MAKTKKTIAKAIIGGKTSKQKMMADAYSDKRTKALDKASSFGKGKMVTESEKMIMKKKK